MNADAAVPATAVRPWVLHVDMDQFIAAVEVDVQYPGPDQRSRRPGYFHDPGSAHDPASRDRRMPRD